MAIFYSFHYDRDYWRVQQIMQMGVIESGQSILTAQQWEVVKRRGDGAIRSWIDQEMKYKSAVVVLIGKETAHRPWVQHEIIKAWKERRPLVGVRIHGLKDSSGRMDSAGDDPFNILRLGDGTPLSRYITTHDPFGWNSQQVHANISANLKTWVTGAYRRP